ncbi:MAG: pseudouridine synthase [Bacteroidetes bacterium]|nr:MAG: pseudouridine synthase [Bacteroidota bacterium]
MAKSVFDKFINKPLKGAKKKELLKQDKKKVKKAREEFFIEKKRADRAAKKLAFEQQGLQQQSYDRKAGLQPGKKSYGKPVPSPGTSAPPKTTGPLPPTAARQATNPKTQAVTPAPQGRSKPSGGYTKFAKAASATPASDTAAPKQPEPAPAKGKKPSRTTTGQTVTLKPQPRNSGAANAKPSLKNGVPFERKPLKQAQIPVENKSVPKPAAVPKAISDEPIMPLNKYLAHGGVTSRRDAGELVKAGKVKVNNVVVQEPGYKVQPGDVVTVAGKRIVQQKNLVYVLLNKPKDFITTLDDPQGRKTVLDIVAKATDQRIYPVGRLDRNTSGVLLLTNDGDLAQRLTHPSFEVKKIYEARLDKALSKADFESILDGITLEDGPVVVDSLAYADSKDKSVIGIEIHSGRNRIVRRLFEHLGYDVKNLDRVMFANLTKKNVERGKWRMLTDKEVRQLKFFGKGK